MAKNNYDDLIVPSLNIIEHLAMKHGVDVAVRKVQDEWAIVQVVCGDLLVETPFFLGKSETEAAITFGSLINDASIDEIE